MGTLAWLACNVAFLLLGSIEKSDAQTAPAIPQVVTVTGGSYILPRQAGTKDAPDVRLSAEATPQPQDRAERMPLPQPTDASMSSR